MIREEAFEDLPRARRPRRPPRLLREDKEADRPLNDDKEAEGGKV